MYKISIKMKNIGKEARHGGVQPSLRRQRQEDHEFKTSLGYIARGLKQEEEEDFA